MTAYPPLVGAVHETVAWALPATAEAPVGAPGTEGVPDALTIVPTAVESPFGDSGEVGEYAVDGVSAGLRIVTLSDVPGQTFKLNPEGETAPLFGLFAEPNPQYACAAADDAVRVGNMIAGTPGLAGSSIRLLACTSPHVVPEPAVLSSSSASISV